MFFRCSSMENHITLEITEQASPEIPSLIKYISTNELDGFDAFESQFPSPTSKVRLFLKQILLLMTDFRVFYIWRLSSAYFYKFPEWLMKKVCNLLNYGLIVIYPLVIQAIFGIAPYKKIIGFVPCRIIFFFWFSTFMVNFTPCNLRKFQFTPCNMSKFLGKTLLTLKKLFDFILLVIIEISSVLYPKKKRKKEIRSIWIGLFQLIY